MKRLNALYYPEIVCLKEDVLKSLLLMYDKIYFLPKDATLNPGHDSISSRFSMNDSVLSSAFGTQKDAYYSLMYTSEKHAWDNKLKLLMDMYDYLEDEKRCIPINDKDFEFSNPFNSSVDSDLQDMKFIYICNKFKNKKLFVPPLPTPSKTKGGGFYMGSPRYEKEFMLYALCSERINNALFFASSHNLVPISTHDLFIKLLGAKLHRVMTNKEFFKDINVKGEKGKIKFGILSWEVFTEIVPLELLIQKNVKEILNYKKETEESQDKFRNYLSSLQLMVNAEPWSESFSEEIKKIVKLEVVPEALKYRENKKVIWEKLFNETIKTTLSKKIIYPLFSMHVIPSISYLDILIYSTIVWAGDMFPKLMDLRQEEKEINRNALFFLLNFK